MGNPLRKTLYIFAKPNDADDRPFASFNRPTVDRIDTMHKQGYLLMTTAIEFPTMLMTTAIEFPTMFDVIADAALQDRKVTLFGNIERDYWVTICAECRCASCWHGEFVCGKSKGADTAIEKASELIKEAREHPQHYSIEQLTKVCGQVEYVDEVDHSDYDK